MTPGHKKFISLIILLLIIILLIRLFPFAIRAAEAAALGVRQFWWLVLVFVFGVWFFFVSKKKP